MPLHILLAHYHIGQEREPQLRHIFKILKDVLFSFLYGFNQYSPTIIYTPTGIKDYTPT